MARPCVATLCVTLAKIPVSAGGCLFDHRRDGCSEGKWLVPGHTELQQGYFLTPLGPGWGLHPHLSPRKPDTLALQSWERWCRAAARLREGWRKDEQLPRFPRLPGTRYIFFSNWPSC